MRYLAPSGPLFIIADRIKGELVFVTSKACKDISPEEAKRHILGYTIGNDLSCRFFQLPKNSGGQFFYAKAFDKFAPIGPTLISPELFETSSRQVITRVNGEVRQIANLSSDMIFSPEQILSHMSQGIFNTGCCTRALVLTFEGTTIPVGTAVMTGTAAGVGAFMKPKTFLQNGDIVEIELDKIGVLRNKITFE
jgi:2-keto-4-pentenoate hydratase/2-oxohepta-3-ene-1,7-dioic acid hydratase in catechol pathway